jgi:hypothetical protein
MVVCEGFITMLALECSEDENPSHVSLGSLCRKKFHHILDTKFMNCCLKHFHFPLQF